MHKIQEEIVLNCPVEKAFAEITTVDFMKRLDPNYGKDTAVILQNERLIRSVSKVENIGDVEIERIIIPESFTIVTERRPPMGPFVYQISLQIFGKCENGTTMLWVNEFELDKDHKMREDYILSAITGNDKLNLNKICNYFNEKNSAHLR
jgi:hypothetical protein